MPALGELSRFEKSFKTKDTHSDIVPRFFSVAGTSVPRVQQLVTKPETERKKGT
jgi:hypothetical protein